MFVFFFSLTGWEITKKMSKKNKLLITVLFELSFVIFVCVEVLYICDCMHVLAYECMYLKVEKKAKACYFRFACRRLFSFDFSVCTFLFGTMYKKKNKKTVQPGQDLGPHATLIYYMNITCFPYGESFKLYIACTLWAAF